MTSGSHARYQLPRTYTPRASALLPPPWAAAIGAVYQEHGHPVEIGTEPNTRGEVKVIVRDLAQHALDCHLNDPLGTPGLQDPRNPQTTIKRYRPRVDAPAARGRKRYRKPGSRMRVQKLLGRPPVPLPGSQAALRREQQEEERAAAADALAAEERRYLRPDRHDDETETDRG